LPVHFSNHSKYIRHDEDSDQNDIRNKLCVHWLKAFRNVPNLGNQSKCRRHDEDRDGQSMDHKHCLDRLKSRNNVLHFSSPSRHVWQREIMTCKSREIETIQTIRLLLFALAFRILGSSCLSSCESFSSPTFESESRLTRIGCYISSSSSLHTIILLQNAEFLCSSCLSACTSLSSIRFNDEMTKNVVRCEIQLRTISSCHWAASRMQ
jgi:hypothetical protein